MNPLFSLEGKTALVTGAGRGLGAACAEALAAAGAHVLLTDVDRAAVERQAQVLRDRNLACSTALLDVGDGAARRAVLTLARERSGGLDILVNNAGIMLRKPIVETEQAEFSKVLDVNVTAMAMLSADAFPLLAERRGRIVNLSSIMGQVGRAGQAAYVASKHAVIGLTKSLAAEFGPAGVTVNAIAPGYFYTEMNRKIVDDAIFHESVIDRTPLRRWAEPSEMAGPLVFLASEASAFVTGHTLMLDGGMSVTVPGPAGAQGTGSGAR